MSSNVQWWQVLVGRFSPPACTRSSSFFAFSSCFRCFFARLRSFFCSGVSGVLSVDCDLFRVWRDPDRERCLGLLPASRSRGVSSLPRFRLLGDRSRSLDFDRERLRWCLPEPLPWPAPRLPLSPERGHQDEEDKCPSSTCCRYACCRELPVMTVSDSSHRRRAVLSSKDSLARLDCPLPFPFDLPWPPMHATGSRKSRRRTRWTRARAARGCNGAAGAQAAA